MQVEVIAIGNEVLAGATVNRNAAVISAALNSLGLRPTRHLVLPDDPAAVKGGLQAALAANQLVICTGGLGPTGDDRTRQAVAEAVGCDLAFNRAVAQRLEERWGDQLTTIEDQATIPSAAQPLHNSVGTAPGLHFVLPRGELFVLPGVPIEMETLLEEQVVPYLRTKYPDRAGRAVAVRFFQVAESAVDAVLRELAPQYPVIEFGIYPQLGLVSVRLSSQVASEAELQAVADLIASRFPSFTYPIDVPTLQAAVHRGCLERGLTLSTAESCTGGAVAACLTQQAGSSEYFRGSCITYSNELKEKILGVAAATLRQCGAVSEETVYEMVTGLLHLTETDLGIAISGIAGPSGGTPKKPVGTVCFAAARRGQLPIVSTLHAQGTRAAVITHAVNYALAEIWKLIRANSG